MKTLKTIKQFLATDLRSLALFRIGLALLIIADLINRARDLEAHYTDFGLLPRGILIDKLLNEWYISLHFISGRIEFQIILFAIAGIFALMLLFGYKTKLSSIISWILLISIQARNPMLLQGGDILFRMLAFFGMFLPLGLVYSIDSLKQKNKIKNKDKTSWLGFVLLFQMVVMYVSAFLHKKSPEWFPDGTAIYYALSLDQFLTPLGSILYKFPSIMQALTYSVYFWWLIGAILLLFSIKSMRTIVVTIFILINIGLGLSLYLGLFPFIVIVGLIALLPSSFWDKKKEKLRKKQEGTKIYYDKDCGFCEYSVRLILMFLILPFTQTEPSQAHKKTEEEMKAHNSWIFEDKDKKHYYRFNAFLKLLAISPIFFPLSKILNFRLAKKIGNKIYRKISANRKIMGCTILKPEHTTLKTRKRRKLLAILKITFLIFILSYILLWNIDETTEADTIKYEQEFIARVLRIDQAWNMFSPRPLTQDGWYIINGTLKNGQNLDLFNKNQPTDWEKPAWVSHTYKNQRWRKYMMNLWDKREDNYLLHYGKWLCRDWNRKHQGNEQLTGFQIIFMREDTLLDYKTRELEKVVLWTHDCFAK